MASLSCRGTGAWRLHGIFARHRMTEMNERATLRGDSSAKNGTIASRKHGLQDRSLGNVIDCRRWLLRQTVVRLQGLVAVSACAPLQILSSKRTASERERRKEGWDATPRANKLREAWRSLSLSMPHERHG